jgi:anti-sigma-K factor RskA
VVSGLPPLPPDRSYQLWLAQADHTWASAGVFRVNARGEAVVLASLSGALSAYYGCGITEEPARGSPAPTGPRVLTGLP